MNQSIHSHGPRASTHCYLESYDAPASPTATTQAGDSACPVVCRRWPTPIHPPAAVPGQHQEVGQLSKVWAAVGDAGASSLEPRSWMARASLIELSARAARCRPDRCCAARGVGWRVGGRELGCNRQGEMCNRLPGVLLLAKRVDRPVLAEEHCHFSFTNQVGPKRGHGRLAG
jgi:hypothetical protein